MHQDFEGEKPWTTRLSAEASCFYDDTEEFLGKNIEFVLCWMADP